MTQDDIRIPTPPCDMCAPYGHPGWLIDAWQIVPCWKCNPWNGKPREAPHFAVDHINGNPHDNRIANLRIVTIPENSGRGMLAWKRYV